MSFQDLLLALGDEIEDPEEETFLLFSQSVPSHNLGFVDPKARNLEITVAGRDLSITQSPGLLSSNRELGTTGAVVWKITPFIAEWINFNDNILFKSSVLDQRSHVLELGCGISGILASTLAPRIRRYIATDQEYVFKLLRSNIEENALSKKVSSEGKQRSNISCTSNIEVLALDWESSSVGNLPMLLSSNLKDEAFQGFNVIIGCDCVYNEALIEPFVTTCVEACELARTAPTGPSTICIIAQQLRSDSVFNAWVSAFYKAFRVWRVPNELLTGGLREGSGFVVHIGILRERTC